VFVCLVTFPWGIVDRFHWWTVSLLAIAAYFMLGLESVSEDVEEPFCFASDDLDLDQLWETIRISVQEAFDRRQSRIANQTAAR